MDAKKIAAFQKSGYKCAHCGKTSTLTLEHVFPKSQCRGMQWRDNEWNLTALCLECNKKKDDRLLNPNEFRGYFKYISPKYINKYYDFYLTRIYDLANGKSNHKLRQENVRLSQENKNLKKQQFNDHQIISKLRNTIHMMFLGVVTWDNFENNGTII